MYFTASIWTDNSDNPGTELGSWTLTSNDPADSCCLVATQTGITGVTLTGGVQYWMVAGPTAPDNGSKFEWEKNSQGQNSQIVASLNGGSWIREPGTDGNAAFDVMGVAATPEPGSLLRMGVGLATIVARLRSKA